LLERLGKQTPVSPHEAKRGVNRYLSQRDRRPMPSP
jgi:hypothetical protein